MAVASPLSLQQHSPLILFPLRLPILDTIPFENDAWINDEYVETQVIDNDEFLLCRETQAMDLGFRTQEEPLVEDEQLPQGFDGLATQVLDFCDGDSDDVTVYLVDNNEVSDSNSRGGNLLPNEDKSREYADEKIKSTGGHGNIKSTGKVARFASVCSAAFRSSLPWLVKPLYGFINDSSLYLVTERGHI